MHEHASLQPNNEQFIFERFKYKQSFHIGSVQVYYVNKKRWFDMVTKKRITIIEFVCKKNVYCEYKMARHLALCRKYELILEM